jgi:hypothetical protein
VKKAVLYQPLPLLERRAILSSVVEPGEHVALSQVSDRRAAEMLEFVKSHRREGAVPKRSDSVSGKRPFSPTIELHQFAVFTHEMFLCSKLRWVTPAPSS